MRPFAELVLPAIRWDPERGFERARAEIERALEAGVGGFILFGGEREAVRELSERLRSDSRQPLLIASDLERGAGQQVRGLTSLPPLLALASLGPDAVREAARITALEARDVGINWVLAPVCDLDLEPENPIVQTRSLGADAYEVAHLAAVWIATCQDQGVLACAKHFPGHGRTTLDSHATLPVVGAGQELGRDLVPFRRAVASGVASVMTAHVAYPHWDRSGLPATYSAPLLRDLLRGDLFFGGLTVTDALIMEGARAGGSEGEAAARALRAGCDLLLYPRDPREAAEGVERAVAGGDRALDAGAAESALRREQAARRAAPPCPLEEPALAAHRARGAELARESVKLLRGEWPSPLDAAAIEIVDDDAGGPYELSARTAFQDELSEQGVELRLDAPTRIVLLFADVKSWKGRAGLSPSSAERLGSLLAKPACVVVFGHPRRLADLPGDHTVICAWSGDQAMQRAAAARLLAAAA